MQRKQVFTLPVNVGPNERIASLIGGGAFLLAAFNRKSAAKFLYALSGGYLLYRGLSGNCLAYEALGIDRAKAYGAGEVPAVMGQTSGQVYETEQQSEEIQNRHRKDAVQRASEESFPASDPPAWTTGPED